MLRPKRKEQIVTAISNEVVPIRSKSSDDLLLRLDNKQYAKLQRRGTTTPAGRFYFAKTETTPQTFDLEGTVVQRGSTEFLVSNRKARVLRRLAGEEYIYTRLGKRYFGAKESQFLIHVPAVIKRAHSTSLGRRFAVPHNAFMEQDLKISSRLPEAERNTKLKDRVLAFMEANLDKLNGKIVLYHDSDPVLYDEDGQWTFDEQTTAEVDGKMQTETTLDRPLGAAPLLPANMLLPQGLCKEAFMDSKGNCVAVQLSALLKVPLDCIEHEIDVIYSNLPNYAQYDVDGVIHSWREMGVSPNIVTQLGLNHGMNVYVLHRGRKISQSKHTKKGKRACLCFSVDGDHAWFYDAENVRRSISHLNVKPIQKQRAVAREFQSTRAEYRKWKAWYEDSTQPGCYDTDDIAEARLTYLKNT